MRRLSIVLAAMALIAWFGWVGVISNGFTTIQPQGWLILFGAPVLTYTCLLAILNLAHAMPDVGRYLLSATVMWGFLVGAWGFIWDWEAHFTTAQYAGIFILPPIGILLGLLLWRWTKGSNDTAKP